MGTRHDKIGQTHSICPECGAVYSWRGGGHCRGGEYGGCCQTFRNDTAADAHRVGPHDPKGLRRCLASEEMLDAGWRLTDRGWTNSKEMDPALVARLSGAATPPDGVSPQGGTDVPDDPENAVGMPSRPVEGALGGHGFPFIGWWHKSKKD